MLKKYYSPCEVSLKLRLRPEAVDNSVYKSLSETTKTSNNASRRCGYFIERRIWSGKRDSNSRPRPWQGRALPTELFPLGWSVLYSTFKFWSGKRDSNSRPRPWQGRALPTELFPLGWSVLYSTFKFWSGKRDSNSRPRPWQGRALPTELFPRTT